MEEWFDQVLRRKIHYILLCVGNIGVEKKSFHDRKKQFRTLQDCTAKIVSALIERNRAI